MGILLKSFAILVVIGGLWVWVSGRSVTDEVVATVPTFSLPASAITALDGEEGAFDKEGTIILNENEGQGGTAYILYTDYSAGGSPSVKTKRLSFETGDKCSELALPCATNQPGTPVEVNQKVRVIGAVKNERVDVQEIYLL